MGLGRKVPGHPSSDHLASTPPELAGSLIRAQHMFEQDIEHYVYRTRLPSVHIQIRTLNLQYIECETTVVPSDRAGEDRRRTGKKIVKPRCYGCLRLECHGVQHSPSIFLQRL